MSGMAFFEEQFPPHISALAEGGPEFFNEKAYVQGRRVVNQLQPLPLGRWTIKQPARSGDDFEQLRAFFWVVGGDRDGFRFKDWTDCVAHHANTSCSLITGSTYQLNRLYRYGTRTFTRPIQKPVAGSVVVYRTRSGVVTQATATVDSTTGIATISGHASGDTYTWEGQYDVSVAFVDPRAVWRVLGSSAMITEWDGIELEEIRL